MTDPTPAGPEATQAPPAPTPTKPPTPPTPPTPPDDDGDASAETDVGRLHAEAAKWRKEARAQQKRADELEAARDAEAATSADRLAKLEAAERRNARATIERLAVGAGFHAGEPAHELDALVDRLGADDGGEQAVAARLAEVAKERPYLLAQNGARGDGRVLTPGRQSDVAAGSADKDAWLRS